MSMNILFASALSKDDNQFVQLHIRILQELGYTVNASLAEFWDPTQSYDIIVINWPESFFGWKVDTSDEEVIQLNNALLRWQQTGVKLLTFFHDEYSHFGRCANLNLLFDLCYLRSNILIHLGNYSKNKYRNLYADAEHYIIHHPLFADFQTDMDPVFARKSIGVSPKDYLVFVPGGIRKREEMDYCLELYRKLPAKNKRLIFQKTSFLSKPQSIKSFTDFKVWVYYLIHTYKFCYLEKVTFLNGFMPNAKLSAYFAGSDLLIIPRTDILNSGNILLGAQFGRPMVGTGTGNTEELLQYLGQYCLKPGMILQLNSMKSEHNSAEIKIAVASYSGDDIIKEQWQKILSR